jgi:hypothetical protein
MCIHFDTRAAAEKHLIENGWTRSSDAWISRDRSCIATFHPIPGSAVVLVGITERPNRYFAA